MRRDEGSHDADELSRDELQRLTGVVWRDLDAPESRDVISASLALLGTLFLLIHGSLTFPFHVLMTRAETYGVHLNLAQLKTMLRQEIAKDMRADAEPLLSPSPMDIAVPPSSSSVAAVSALPYALPVPDAPRPTVPRDPVSLLMKLIPSLFPHRTFPLIPISHMLIRCKRIPIRPRTIIPIIRSISMLRMCPSDRSRAQLFTRAREVFLV